MNLDTLDATRTPTFMGVEQECDLVMKGGITSGIVYPPALIKLATKYRFRSIGGTSAGAIAAAAAAAAEYGRETGGFEHLQQLQDTLGQDQFLFHLFQSSKTTRPLMDTLLALAAEWKNGQKGRYTRTSYQLTKSLLQHRPAAFAQGALLGGGLSALAVWLAGGSVKRGGSLPQLLLFSWLGGLVKGGYDLSQILLKELPQQNFFGLCMGLRDDGVDERVDVLTEWLSASINTLAGRKDDAEPLTFADLQGKMVNGQDCSIMLRMVTTNLSQGRPYVLPFDVNDFIFNEDEMRRLFPASVVNYLVKNAYHSDSVSLKQVPKYHHLPPGNKLPVVVGMRLSLSFPLLISAVPLYTVKQSAWRRRERNKPLVITYDNVQDEGDLQRHWFSDGGICSNFPIHFFDAWLPTRPTFGINLTSLPEEAFKEDKTTLDPEYRSMSNVELMAPQVPEVSDTNSVVSKAVYIPRANERPITDWTKISDLQQFAKAIFWAAQNYRDTTQSILPSYRERIVQVRFAPQEGGLNLAMKPETIQAIQAKGAKAADKILTHFNLEHHQWVRFQVLMALMERQLRDLGQALRDIDYEQIFDRQIAASAGTDRALRFPYPRERDWCDEALIRVQGLLAFVERFNQQAYLVTEPPRPEPVLRVTPEF